MRTTEKPEEVSELNQPFSKSDIREMLFSLNVKLPMLFEQREELDTKIAAMQTKIAVYQRELASIDGNVLMIQHPRRGRPPKALIEAAAGNKEERRRNHSEGAKQRWANYSPRQRKALLNKMHAARWAAK